MVLGTLFLGDICLLRLRAKKCQGERELGRIGKTRHILQFVYDEAFRRRVLVGLNKGELLNDLARVLFYGQQGRFTHREYETQLNRATALSLLINAIIVWNTRYLSAAGEHLGVMTEEHDSHWRHMTPICWEHIQIVGNYSFAEWDLGVEE